MMRSGRWNRRWLAGAALMQLFGASAVAGGLTDWRYLAHTQIEWRSYGDAALAEAGKTGRPLFVLLFSDSCRWCRKYETEAIEPSVVRELINDRFVPVAVNVDREPGLARKLGARVVPTTLILSPGGVKLLRFHGVQPAADLADTLQQLLVLWRRGELPEQDFGDIETCCPVGQGRD